MKYKEELEREEKSIFNPLVSMGEIYTVVEVWHRGERLKIRQPVVCIHDGDDGDPIYLRSQAEVDQFIGRIQEEAKRAWRDQ